MTIGTKVSRLRRRRKLSQQELADCAGVSQTIISKLETDHHANVTADVLKGLALALGCTADYLLGMHEDDDSDEQPTAQAPRGGQRTRAGEAR